ncbi:glycosyl transferase family 1 protein [Musa troglodytarum]|nr:glycosyl transferase family 1 protein [Musa troglodytarum]
MSFHQTPPSPAGYLNQGLAWEQFQTENATGRPFDVIHSESVGLLHGRARNISNLAASWHGIAYETIHSDVVQDLLRGPDEPRRPTITERLSKVIEEVKFFPHYAHHVATSDHVGDVLKRIYMIPEERVHIVVNGVDESIYRPDRKMREEFRRKVGVPDRASLVIGLAGRLVKDKGHPLMFEALKQVFGEEERFRRDAFVLVAGDGPWGNRYKELGRNIIVLGPLEQSELAKFYNSLDVYLNPTLRAQGLDHTFIEAMLSGVAIAGTRFASITGSLIVGSDVGYTFLPTVESLKESLHKIMKDGKQVLSKKGEVARSRALRLFTATKMAAAYERLFLCISKEPAVKDNIDYCRYPLPWDSGKLK